jgi:hypothetical protein
MLSFVEQKFWSKLVFRKIEAFREQPKNRLLSLSKCMGHLKIVEKVMSPTSFIRHHFVARVF